MIPLSTDRPLSRKPAVTPALISINIGVFLAMLILASRDPEGAFRVQQAGWVGRDQPGVYRYLTSAFLHGGFLHLAGNMLFLWVFGPPVEDRLGRWWFLVFYILAAVASGWVHVVSDPVPAIGASGAIAGVTGAYLVLFPLTRVRTLMFFGIIGLVMVPSWFFVGLKIAFDLFAQGFSEDNVANMAHLGGYGFGITLSLLLLRLRFLASEPYDLMTMIRQRQRRRQFRAASEISRSSGPRVGAQAAPSDPESDELAERRSAVSELVAHDKLGEAADAYEQLLNTYAHRPHAGTLSREAQLKLVGYLLGSDRRRLAARALDGFMSTYPRDPERHSLAVLLGRLCAHDLGDAGRARELFKQAADQQVDTSSRDIARDELATLDSTEQT